MRGRRHLLSQLLCLGRHTITGLLRNQDRTQQDWTADYRFYSEDRFQPEKLFDQVRGQIEKLSAANAPLVVAMDDSLLRKTGRKIHGSRYQRDPLSPPFHVNFVRGLRVLQISAALPQGDEGAARLIPVDFHHAALPAKPHKKAPAEQHALYEVERAKKNINIVGKDRLVRLRQQMDQGPGRNKLLVVTVDNRFTNSTVLRHVPERTVLIGRIRKDAALFHAPQTQPERGRKKKYGRRCPTPEQILKDETIAWQSVEAYAAGGRYQFKVKTQDGVFSAMDKGQRPLRLVVIEPVPYRRTQTSKLERREPAYLICTDPQLALQELLQMFLWRWDIEVNFRDEKTVLGVGQAQVRSEKSNQNAPALAVAAYAMLLLASVKTYAADSQVDRLKNPRWYKQKHQQRPTTNALINQLRYEMWASFLKRTHFQPFSPNPASNQTAQKCDHPLAAAVFMSVA